MSKKSLTKINALSEADISAVIQLAWEDRTSCETIEQRVGVCEAEVIRIMRQELKSGSFQLWRKRMKGRVTKHRALRDPDMDYKDIATANHRRANC